MGRERWSIRILLASPPPRRLPPPPLRPPRYWFILGPGLLVNEKSNPSKLKDGGIDGKDLEEEGGPSSSDLSLLFFLPPSSPPFSHSLFPPLHR
eukprot:937286-Pyramimonas_sp.AAC.2